MKNFVKLAAITLSILLGISLVSQAAPSEQPQPTGDEGQEVFLQNYYYLRDGKDFVESGNPPNIEGVLKKQSVTMPDGNSKDLDFEIGGTSSIIDKPDTTDYSQVESKNHYGVFMESLVVIPKGSKLNAIGGIYMPLKINKKTRYFSTTSNGKLTKFSEVIYPFTFVSIKGPSDDIKPEELIANLDVTIFKNKDDSEGTVYKLSEPFNLKGAEIIQKDGKDYSYRVFNGDIYSRNKYKIGSSRVHNNFSYIKRSRLIHAPGDAKKTDYKFSFSDITGYKKTQTGDIMEGEPVFTDFVKIYNIKFDPKDKGLISSGSDSIVVEYGKKLDMAPSVKPLSGYDFLGWTYKGQDVDIKNFDPSTLGDGKLDDIVLEAKYKKKNSNGTSHNNNKPDRVNGNDRIETAIEVSKKYYGKADTVIIARSDLYPDSLTAGVLAKAINAPILLTKPYELDSRVKKEIERLGAKDVIIVGGLNSIMSQTEKSLNEFDKDIERLGGADRYVTSTLIAKRVTDVVGKKNIAVIASGEVFADALSVGPYAAQKGYPILLVKKNMVPTSVNKSFMDLNINNIYVIGGYSTIERSMEDKLPKTIERIGGADRYETSAMIAKSKFPNSRQAFIASGEVFADSLVIGPVAGRLGAPVLLTNGTVAPKVIVDYVAGSSLKYFTTIGGLETISDAVVDQITGK